MAEPVCEYDGDGCTPVFRDAEPDAPDTCEVCGSDDIDHGVEHMGTVEFPESICEECWRKRQDPETFPEYEGQGA